MGLAEGTCGGFTSRQVLKGNKYVLIGVAEIAPMDSADLLLLYFVTVLHEELSSKEMPIFFFFSFIFTPTLRYNRVYSLK